MIWFAGIWVVSRSEVNPSFRVSGLVVRMPSLGLECQEDCNPTVGLGEVDEECPILVYSIVPVMVPFGVALVHVDVVDAVAGIELKNFIAFAFFRTKTGAEGI